MISDHLKIAFIQSDIYWEDINKNLKHLDHVFSGFTDSPDLIVLPEMFNTGFTMNAEKNFEYMDGRTVFWLKNNATRYNAAITGSIIIKEDNKFYNRLLFVKPDGTVSSYDKAHLFRITGENKVYTSGTRKLVIEYKGWRICPLICYDLRFPVWSRNKEDFHLLIYIANWPESRKEVWNVLLKARAIENQSYCMGVNRKGKDGNNIKYAGDSMVIDPQGNTIERNSSNKKESMITGISLKRLKAFREIFPVYLDADKFVFGKK